MRRGYDSFLWKLFDSSAEELLELFGWIAALAALLVVLVWAVVRIKSRFRDDDDPAAVDRSMLLAVGDLHRSGDLSDEEYRSIKSQLIDRVGQSLPTGSQAEPKPVTITLVTTDKPIPNSSPRTSH